MIKNFEKDYKSFTPIKLSKIDRCKNTRTKAEWIEATDFTSAHLEDKLDITDLMNSLTPFDDINENDYYLITGTIKFVNQTPIFNPADPTKPSGVKPIIEPGQKGDLFHLRFVVSNVQNENINVSVGKFNHLINAYPEAPPNDFAKWFQNATDEDRLKEIQMALQGASIIALGRGSRYMDKDGVPTQLKKPFLYVAEDGIIVNVEQWQNNGGSSSQMKLEDSKTTQTPVQTSMPSLPSPTPAAAQPTSKITVGEIAEAVMKSIVAGKGGKEDLIGALPSQLGVDSQKIVEVIKDLSNRGEIYKEGSVYKSTSELP